MIIAFDIDGVWTEDPVAWAMVRGLLESRGHSCVIITGASQPEAKLTRLGLLKDEVNVCRPGECKEELVSRLGGSVDVWIDDNPWLIRGLETKDTEDTKL